MPQDLQDFVGVPLQYYQPVPTPVPVQTLLNWIRFAEDYVEQETGLLLCPTWVASPPLLSPVAAANSGVVPASSETGGQVIGKDYDLEDAAYDFFLDRSQDSGWTCQPLRYRPVRNAVQPSRIVTEQDFNGVKNVSFIYPLLEQFFRVPPSWFVTDADEGLIRLVPAENVAILPLWSLQLAVLGFSDTLPGGLYLQYTAGLMPNDYNSRWRFVQELVLSIAAIRALSAIQGTLNMGLTEHSTQQDGVMFTAKYSEKGPYWGLIQQFTQQRNELMYSVQTKLGGPIMLTL
ncbi:MAG: hypothetical protein KGI54_18015 [Pseudomonadota bacterium]|nr:hypothetical protein [Pseudomonadota bacterium]